MKSTYSFLKSFINLTKDNKFIFCKIFNEDVCFDDDFIELIFYVQSITGGKFYLNAINPKIKIGEFNGMVFEFDYNSKEIFKHQLKNKFLNNNGYYYHDIMLLEWYIISECRSWVVYANKLHEYGLFVSNFEVGDLNFRFPEIFLDKESVINLIDKKFMSKEVLKFLDKINF